MSISKDNLQVNQTYFINAECATENCKFSLLARYAKGTWTPPPLHSSIHVLEHLLTFNQKTTHVFDTRKNIIFRVFIPDDAAIEHINIDLEIFRDQTHQNDIKLYVNKGTDPPST